MTDKRHKQNSRAAQPQDRGQFVLGVLIFLAVAASVVMLITDSQIALKIALIGALWSAILGLFLVFRYRRQLEDSSHEMENLETIHLAELEQAAAAQKAEVSQLKEEIESNLHQQDQIVLEEIRRQLETMRIQLSELSGREWFFEPTVLHAEARRILELENEQMKEEQRTSLPASPESTPTAVLSRTIEENLVSPPSKPAPPAEPKTATPEVDYRETFTESPRAVKPLDTGSTNPELTPVDDHDFQEPVAQPSFSLSTEPPVRTVEPPVSEKPQSKRRKPEERVGGHRRRDEESSEPDFGYLPPTHAASMAQTSRHSHRRREASDTDAVASARPQSPPPSHGRRRRDEHSKALTVAALLAEKQREGK